MNSILKSILDYKEIRKTEKIADSLELKFSLHNLKNLKIDNVNAFEILDNSIYLYPLNDGRATNFFEFYNNNEKIISNEKSYSQLSNLDDIILHMVRTYNKALDKGIVLDPYSFMLELTDDVCKDYRGKADLVITEKAIRNPHLSKHNFDKANKYYINRFLDQFIGWNFGLSVNRNEILRKELEKLNEKVIDMDIREWAGPGFEVYGLEDEEENGLQHYKLLTEKEIVKKKVINKEQD